MTTRPRAHQLEEESITKLREAFGHVGWTVERLHEDYGEDLLVRIFKEQRATPFSFFVQAKASDSCRLDAAKHCLLTRIEVKHLRHWREFGEPVFLTLYDGQTGMTYWEEIHYYLGQKERAGLRHDRKTISVGIPLANRLDADGLQRIFSLTKQRWARYARVVEGASVLAEMLEERAGVEFPDGLQLETEVITYKANGEHHVIYFGELAQLAAVYTKRTGKPVLDSLRVALEEELRVKKSGNEVIVPEGLTIPAGKYTRPQYLQAVRKRDELWAAEDLKSPSVHEKAKSLRSTRRKRRTR